MSSMDHTGNKSLSDFRVLSCDHDVFQIKSKSLDDNLVKVQNPSRGATPGAKLEVVLPRSAQVERYLVGVKRLAINANIKQECHNVRTLLALRFHDRAATYVMITNVMHLAKICRLHWIAFSVGRNSSVGRALD